MGYDKYMNLKKVRKNHCGGVLRLGFCGEVPKRIGNKFQRLPFLGVLQNRYS